MSKAKSITTESDRPLQLGPAPSKIPPRKRPSSTKDSQQPPVLESIPNWSAEFVRPDLDPNGLSETQWDSDGPGKRQVVVDEGISASSVKPVGWEGLDDLIKHETKSKRVHQVAFGSENSNLRHPLKKLRTRFKFGHKLHPSFFKRKTIPAKDESLPESPLFFSHNPRRRPALPKRFSSSEAGIRMLKKTRDERGSGSSGVTTLRLARGSYSGPSPPRAASTPGGRIAYDRTPSIRGISTESPDNSGGASIINQVGIVELLEQDERPTFLLDLGNPSNYSPGPLQISYANPSLQEVPGLLDSILGKIDQESPGLTTSQFSEFKAWATSFVKKHESMEVSLPSFLYQNITWTCSTLRKRIRVINGSWTNLPTALATNSSLGAGSTTNVSSDRSRGPPGTIPEEPLDVETELGKETEPMDYFGNAVASPATNGTRSEKEDIISTIEEVPTPPKYLLTSIDDDLISPDAKTDSLYPGDGGTSPALRASSGKSVGPKVNANSPFDNPFGPQMSFDLGFFDWTRLPDSPLLPKHIRFAKSVDWASTALGPMENWSRDLRSMCNLIMASPHPAAMYWGDEYIAIYNEAYVLLAGQKHPQLMGSAYAAAWSEIWSDIKDVFSNARLTGQSIMKDDDRLFIQRSGFLEETYFSWSIIPLVGDDGSVVGLYNPCFEKTRRKVAERRMLTLREVGEKTAAAREVSGFWGEVLKGLDYNEFDTPFVLLYSVLDESDSDVSSVQSIHSNSHTNTKQCILEGSLGVPDGHQAAPIQLDLKACGKGFCPHFREAMKNDRPVVLETENGTLDPELIEGISWRGFGDPCKSVVVCPIHPTTGDAVLGFLVMGVNPRRPFDDDYNLFIQLLSRQLATSMASVVLFEEEIRRGRRAARLAAADKIELHEQLAARTQEAVESETRFTRMAEFAPVGMFIADRTGRITYCNDTFYEISRHPREVNSAYTWIDSVMDEDKDKVKDLLDRVVTRKLIASAEFRFKTPWEGRNGARGDTWVLASTYPEKNSDGSLKSVFGSLTNISQQKWAENIQKGRMEEAVELKRQQENFIDITSHEMRNPLSAILQCADEISSSLSEFRSLPEPNSIVSSKLVESNIDAAQIIALCAQHQKRIVDDILTLSKLDSALLLVTPVDVQPVTVVQRALKMFEGEMETNDIELKFGVDRTYHELNIDWVRLDPSRLLQVLINLTTNAIKFTTSQESRTIIVCMGASLERPTEDTPRSVVSYFPTRSSRKDIAESSEWGTGEQVYIHFAVKDTGRGLTEEEKKLLFIRFSQASPRTHVQYGGSGLGLFISRELTELQGGEIGVASESGKGSTFAFYVKARRSTAPKESLDIPSTLGRKSSTGKKENKMTTADAISKPYQPSSKVTPKTTAPKVDLSMYQVLIVEDNLVNQRVLKKQLVNLGCEVHVANHGREALDFLKKTTFWKERDTDGRRLSVILMDLEMPVMDGLTATREIRRLEDEGDIVRHVPIIAVTANARSEQISTARGAGMDDVVSKPFRIPELIPKIEELTAKFPEPSSAAVTLPPD